MRFLLTIVAMTLSVTCMPACAREARMVSLVPAFDAAVGAGRGKPDGERVAAFRNRVAARLPDFYGVPPGREHAYAKRVLREIDAYPAQRPHILAAAAAIERRYRSASTRFRRFFPDYRGDTPVYVLHSLGQMDGGTRTIGGRTALLFGADVIARIHDDASVGPLLDHELFHTHHARFFPECGTLWCGLWTEGLAVYVAGRMNPGADDRALLITQPAPIRAAVDARWRQAVCMTLARLDSTAAADVDGYFSGGAALPGWPDRMGYYVGMRVAAKLGETMPLDRLATLPPDRVRAAVEVALRGMAACG